MKPYSYCAFFLYKKKNPEIATILEEIEEIQKKYITDGVLEDITNKLPLNEHRSDIISDMIELRKIRLNNDIILTLSQAYECSRSEMENKLYDIALNLTNVVGYENALEKCAISHEIYSNITIDRRTK